SSWRPAISSRRTGSACGISCTPTADSNNAYFTSVAPARIADPDLPDWLGVVVGGVYRERLRTHGRSPCVRSTGTRLFRPPRNLGADRHHRALCRADRPGASAGVVASGFGRLRLWHVDGCDLV